MRTESDMGILLARDEEVALFGSPREGGGVGEEGKEGERKSGDEELHGCGIVKKS